MEQTQEINQDLETILKFLTQVSQQDNRHTASPIYYVIRTKVERPAYEGCGDRTYYFDGEDPEHKFDSVEDYVAKMKEYSDYENMLEEEKEEFDEKMDDAEYKLDSYEVCYEWEEKGMFLTETDAENHLKSNYYHYSEDAHTYVRHAWRAHELKDFMEALFNYFKIPKGNTEYRLRER